MNGKTTSVLLMAALAAAISSALCVLPAFAVKEATPKEGDMVEKPAPRVEKPAPRAEKPAPRAEKPALRAEKAEVRRPPGWESWSRSERADWTKGLERAKEAVRKHEKARLSAALDSMEKAAREGVPLQEAEQMAVTGLDNGLKPEEFGHFGKFVTGKVRQGLRGKGLAEAIHEEIKRRHQLRWQERERTKQGKAVRKLEKVEFIHRRRPAEKEQESEKPRKEEDTRKGKRAGSEKGRR